MKYLRIEHGQSIYDGCPGPPYHNCTDRNHPVEVELIELDRLLSGEPYRVAARADALGRIHPVTIQIV